MTKVAERYVVLFAQGRVDGAGLARAVRLGLLSQQEADTILTPPESGAESEA